MSSTQPTFAAETAPKPLSLALGEMWWLVLLRGLAAILFGVLAYAWPGVTLLSLALLWGAYSAADGIFALIAAFSRQATYAAPRWWLAIVGVAGIAAGIVAFVWPGITAWVLVLVIAFWAIIIGLFQIIGAIALRKEIEGEWMLILSGGLAMLFGVILLVLPAAGILALIWTIASFAIVYGILLVALSFRVKGMKAAR
jgi:uncharacterized membrane protein HdeD (DUF308 family)